MVAIKGRFLSNLSTLAGPFVTVHNKCRNKQGRLAFREYCVSWGLGLVFLIEAIRKAVPILSHINQQATLALILWGKR